MARPSKFTPETIKKLTDALSIGGSVESAARYAGIGESTFYAWQAGVFPKGATKERIQEFSDALMRAQGEADMNDLIVIRQSAKAGDWRAAAWGLERRHRKEYGTTVQEHTGPDGAPLMISVVRIHEPEPS